MNLKQLEVFIAVAESGSFSRAAELAFITQSTVSQHVNSLEKEFGLRLFDRTSKGVLLTEAGKILLLRARHVTTEAREIPLALNRFKGLEDAALNIGGSNIPATYMISEILPIFHRLHPGVTITLRQDDSRETLERLLREEVELAFIGNRFDEPRLHYTPLHYDKVSLVVSAGHRWSTIEKVTADDLKDEIFIFQEPGSVTDKTLRSAMTIAGFDIERLNIKTYLSSNEAVKQAILNGAGISFLSEMSVKRECEIGSLSLVRVEGLEIVQTIYMVNRLGREMSPPAEAFASLSKLVYNSNF